MTPENSEAPRETREGEPLSYDTDPVAVRAVERFAAGMQAAIDEDRDASQ